MLELAKIYRRLLLERLTLSQLTKNLSSSFRHVTIMAIFATMVACGGGSGDGDPVLEDITPNAFSFPAVQGATISTLVESAPITVAGINNDTSISVANGEYSIEGGAYTSSAGTVANGQAVQVRVAASSTFATSSSASITIGGVSASFEVTTEFEDTIPDGFNFEAKTQVAISSLVESDEITISGINSVTSISIVNGEYAIDGGSFTAEEGVVDNGQLVKVRQNSADTYETESTTQLTIGGVTGSFVATTEDGDSTPDDFSFEQAKNVVPSTWVESNQITISGINVAADISITNGQYSIDGGNFTQANGEISNGQTLRLRLTASADSFTTTETTVSVGDFEASFSAYTTVPNFTAEQVVSDGGDIIYLLNRNNNLVYRWSISQAEHLEPLSVGLIDNNVTYAPNKMTYSAAHDRLYFGYSNNEIHYIDLMDLDGLMAFANTVEAVEGLIAVGNYLLAQDSSGSWNTHFIFDADGNQTDSEDWNRYSLDYAWSETNSRVYFFRDGTSPNDLHYEEIDQTSGEITADGETPYHGDYSITPPINVSVDGQQVLLGSGDLYDGLNLNWLGSIGTQVAAAKWLADNSLVTLTNHNGVVTLQRRIGSQLDVVEQLTYEGSAKSIIGNAEGMVLVLERGAATVFVNYVPSDDSDGDGVLNSEDAFPLDPAASVDTDNDGYPDAWNEGHDETTSTTGLILDAYPNDSACYLTEHGDGVNCDYNATVPDYEPDHVVTDGNIIYLLSQNNERVYRWSIADSGYINPYIIGIRQGLTVLTPTELDYSAEHNRLYLGYSTGQIRYIDTTGNGEEIAFTNTAQAVGGLAAVGNYLLAQDASGAWNTHYIFDIDGNQTDSKDWNYFSNYYSWNAANSKVYFFRDNTSPNDLHFEEIDQNTGEITADGESPYHGDYSIVGPINVSNDGAQVLLGSGDLYNGTTLDWIGAITTQNVAAKWLTDNSLVTLSSSGVTTLQRRNSNLDTVVEELSYDGLAKSIIGSDDRMILVLTNNGTTIFEQYVPVAKKDNDG